ncbi:MAG: flagellar export protein FliJ [Candidatus Melainabacteria bacterium]
MKRFQFRLQTVLDYRTEQLDQAQQAVAREQTRLNDLRRQLSETDTFIESTLQQQAERQQSGDFDIAQAVAFPLYLIRLKEQRALQYQAILQQETLLNEARAALQEALIRKKSLDCLKEKQQTQHTRQIEKHQEQALEEIALNQFYRKRKPA